MNLYHIHVVRWQYFAPCVFFFGIHIALSLDPDQSWAKALNTDCSRFYAQSIAEVPCTQMRFKDVSDLS